MHTLITATRAETSCNGGIQLHLPMEGGAGSAIEYINDSARELGFGNIHYNYEKIVTWFNIIIQLIKYYIIEIRMIWLCKKDTIKLAAYITTANMTWCREERHQYSLVSRNAAVRRLIRRRPASSALHDFCSDSRKQTTVNYTRDYSVVVLMHSGLSMGELIGRIAIQFYFGGILRFERGNVVFVEDSFF